MADYLYHYTTVETLASILKNRTIRFTPLNRVDDLQEQQAADAKGIGRITYVSCWTEDETDNIPMWNMYASLESGVRIRVKKNPFKYRICDFELIKKLMPNTALEINGIPRTLVPYSEMMEKSLSLLPILQMEC